MAVWYGICGGFLFGGLILYSIIGALGLITLIPALLAGAIGYIQELQAEKSNNTWEFYPEYRY